MTALALTVMQFNIEYGGTGVDFAAVPRAIEASGADVVAIQEGCGQVPAIAEALGWRFFDIRTQVLSRYPLLDPPEPAAGAILVESEPGKVFAVVNVHPTSRAYGPTRIARGDDVDTVVRSECRTRLFELLPSLRMAEGLVQQGIPVILLGDFNAPSHRDWSADAISLRPERTVSVPWPTSIAAEASGLVDVYRRHFPDATTHPGITWPAARPRVPGYNPHLHSVTSDRIDLMFVSDDVASTSIRIMGEASSEFSDISVDPWPTDHRALVAELRLEPATPATLVSVSPRAARVGDTVDVRVIALDGDARQVVVTTSGGGAPAVSAGVSVAGAAIRLDLSDVAPGRYDVAALDDSSRELARCSLRVMAADAAPRLAADAASYRMGEPITLRWRDAPGNRADWVAVFARGADPATAKRFVLVYTDATIDGEAVLDVNVRPGVWPLLPAEYTAFLLQDDRPVILASTGFTVTH